MKKTIILLFAATMLLCVTKSFAGVDKQIDNIIKTENITVSDYHDVMDSLDSTVDSAMSATGSVGDEYLSPMTPGENWLKNNWHWLLGLVIFTLQVILKVKPTTANWDLVDKLFSILQWIWNIIPNNAKNKDEIIKRGFDRKTKRVIDAYRKK